MNRSVRGLIPTEGKLVDREDTYLVKTNDINCFTILNNESNRQYLTL
jgi:hypothetical protein